MRSVRILECVAAHLASTELTVKHVSHLKHQELFTVSQIDVSVLSV